MIWLLFNDSNSCTLNSYDFKKKKNLWRELSELFPVQLVGAGSDHT